MGRGRSTANYAAGSLLGNTFNIYLHGTAILSILTFVIGLGVTGSFEDAVRIVFEFNLSKLLAWPWDELLPAESGRDLLASHVVTIGVGLVSATYNYWRNPGYGRR